MRFPPVTALAVKIIALVFHGVLPWRSLGFLFVVGLDDVARHGAGDRAAMFASLDEHGDHDFRVAPRGVSDKPSVVLEALLLADFVARIVADDLRAARF